MTKQEIIELYKNRHYTQRQLARLADNTTFNYNKIRSITAEAGFYYGVDTSSSKNKEKNEEEEVDNSFVQIEQVEIPLRGYWTAPLYGSPMPKDGTLCIVWYRDENNNDEYDIANYNKSSDSFYRNSHLVCTSKKVEMWHALNEKIKKLK